MKLLLRYGWGVVMTVIAFVLTAGINSEYMRRLEGLALFIPGKHAFADSFLTPGGPLEWCCRFLNQFLYYPWVGATLLVLILAAIFFVSVRLFNLRGWLTPLALIIPALFLLQTLIPGYSIFLIKSQGWVFTNPLGLLISLLCAWLYKSLGNPVSRGCLAVLTAGIGFPLFGFYATLAQLLYIGAELRGRRNWIVMAVTVAVAVAAPFAYYQFFPGETMSASLWLYPTPRFLPELMGLATPTFVAAGVAVLLILAAPKKVVEKPKLLWVIAMQTIGAACVAAVIFGSYSEENFTLALKMDEALNNRDYEQVVELAENQEGTPSRLVGLDTQVALARLGQLGNRMYQFPCAVNEYNTGRPDLAMRQTSGRALNWRFGRVNDAYRWCMEDVVEFGPTAEYYLQMAKCALINGEYNLARRYLVPLSRTLFHKEEANKYLAYCDNPALADKDPEFAEIRPLMQFNNHIGGDGGLVEAYIMRSLAMMDPGSPQLTELSVMYNLALKDIQRFWPRLFRYLNQTGGKMPVHMQEAAILFSELEHQVDWHQLPVSPEVAKRFDAFMDKARANAGMSNDYNLSSFAPQFGNTYWYYYFFLNDIKTN